MNKYNFKCHSCQASINHESEANHFSALKEIQWQGIFDLSNGMTTVNFCPECIGKARILANQLQEIIKLDHFHFNTLLK